MLTLGELWQLLGQYETSVQSHCNAYIHDLTVVFKHIAVIVFKAYIKSPC